MNLNSGKPLFRSGDKIVCPRCKGWLYRLTMDIYYAQRMMPEMFEEIPPQSKALFGTPCISDCCGVAWFANGALCLIAGWKPYDPLAGTRS